ncbi:MAG: NAD(P)H-hydrate epimerase [Candidatus Helarchaeota archaeon]
MTEYLSLYGVKIPMVTAKQMNEIDHLLTDEFHFDLMQLMENAGRNLAELVKRYYGGSVEGKFVLVVAGKGNNGGGGLVAARHLHNWGAKINLFFPSPSLKKIPTLQRAILEPLSIETWVGKDAYQYLIIGEGDLIIDAVIGYRLIGNPRGWAARMIEAINAAELPVIALDIPSGLEATSGHIFDPCVKAIATLTLALPKTGLFSPNAEYVTGSIYLADIGVPYRLYEQLGLEVGNLFSRDTIIQLR